MKNYQHLLLANKAWAAERLEDNADYFIRQTAGQRPEFFWIGCSDSRVAPDQLTNTEPGGMFIHRNIANLVNPHDLNLMSGLQFAVDVLGVEHIIVCGHYGCAGIAATLEGGVDGPTLEWLKTARDVYLAHADELDALPENQRGNRLVELNVRDQLVRLARTEVIQRAFASGKPLELHGWIYDIRDGLLKPLMEVHRSTPLDDIPHPDPVLL